MTGTRPARRCRYCGRRFVPATAWASLRMTCYREGCVKKRDDQAKQVRTERRRVARGGGK